MKDRIEILQNYLLKNRNFALYGLSKDEVIKQLHLKDEQVQKLRKKNYSIPEVVELLVKIENVESNL